MFNHFRSSYGTSLFSDEFLAGFFSPQFDPFMRLPSMDPYFSGHAQVPKTQIICIEVLETMADSSLSFVHPSIVEPVEESDEESIDEISSEEDDMEVTNEEDRLTVHDITGQNFVISCPESNSYLVDSGYASDEEDNDEEKLPNNNNNNSPNAEMPSSEQSMSESDSDSQKHRYKHHEHEKMRDQPRHHVKRAMKEERYFEDSSRHKKRSKTEKSSSASTSVKWDWNQNKFV